MIVHEIGRAEAALGKSGIHSPAGIYCRPYNWRFYSWPTFSPLACKADNDLGGKCSFLGLPVGLQVSAQLVYGELYHLRVLVWSQAFSAGLCPRNRAHTMGWPEQEVKPSELSSGDDDIACYLGLCHLLIYDQHMRLYKRSLMESGIAKAAHVNGV